MTYSYTAEAYDVAVVGAGHAGLEAALASARLGAKTALFTLSLDLVGNMPCNPSIGGSGKGHLVFEIDALGGEMGRAADSVMLQSRMLNLSKGPAVQSLRQQADRRAYQAYMKRAVERTANLTLVQCEITGLRVEGGRVCMPTTRGRTTPFPPAGCPTACARRACGCCASRPARRRVCMPTPSTIPYWRSSAGTSRRRCFRRARRG